MKKLLAPCLLAALLTASPLPAAPGGIGNAAEFDLDSGRIILRRLQYCLDCGSALLVTTVPTGVSVRCPDCGREQTRIEDKHTLTQLYQICKVCAGPLDPHEHKPGDVIECSHCHTRQPLSRDAFATGDTALGSGFVPGFPPGSGKKTLLLSPNQPDTQLTVIPLEEGSGELPLPSVETAPRRIPQPPREPTVTAAAAPMPPLPELHAGSGGTKPLLHGDDTDAVPSRVPYTASTAVDVPAVTADLFGGGTAEDGVLSSGKVVAKVDGIAIHDRDVERVVAPVMDRLRRSGQADGEALAQRERDLRREVLERLVDRELILREAAALGHKPAAAAVRERENELAQILAGTGADLRREAERDVIVADMRRRFAEKPATATPKDVRDFYRKHKDALLRPRLVALDQLVVFEDRKERADPRGARSIALEISQSLEQGLRFDDMRERYDEFAAATGVEREQPSLQPEAGYARQVVAAGGDMRRGAVFGPVILPGMILFAKVVDERPAGPVPFDEVEKEIRERLEAEATEQALDAWIRRLRNKAKIELLSN